LSSALTRRSHSLSSPLSNNDLYHFNDRLGKTFAFFFMGHGHGRPWQGPDATSTRTAKGPKCFNS
jgi:hypothetical protein